MGKLIKHLKPFIWSIVAIFVLLFGQAMANLALPGYMANIVNVGIEQKDIENTVPQAVSSTEFNKIAIFMTDSQKTQVTGDYILLDKQTLSPADYANYVKTYPQLATTDIYKLNTSNKTEISQLDSIFSKAIPAVFTLEQSGTAIFAQYGIQLPAGTDPFVFIKQLPPAQLTQLISAAESQISATPSILLTGAATTYIAAQY